MLIYSLCLDREKERYAHSSTSGHISRVKNYSKTCSTTTLKEHLTSDHKKISQSDNPEEKPKLTQSQLVLKRKLENFEPCSTRYELNRDLAIWASLDLEPFMFTEKPGMTYFFDKNFPKIALPSRSTLSRGALYDVHDAIQTKVNEELQLLKGGAICIMMDGWTDKYKRYPYLGLRVGYVDDWTYKVVTISLKVLEKHTSANMAAHVRKELADCGLQLNRVQVFTTHDGAANMVKTSQLLRSYYFQHCIAHSLHLLLVTDGINNFPDIVDLLTRCKKAVIKLDSKCYLVDHEIAKSKDREAMDKIIQKISLLTELLQADDNVSFGSSDSDEESEHFDTTVERSSTTPMMSEGRVHKTLKQSCPTRWNSILAMIDSVIDLWTELNEALKVNGDRELCLTEEDKVLLCELQRFLKPFHDLTELVSSEQGHLGLIPLIIREVKDAAKLDVRDSESISQLKQSVLDNLPNRIKMSETVTIASLLDPSIKSLIMSEVPFPEAKQLLQRHTHLAYERMLRVSAPADPVATPTKAEEADTSNQDRDVSGTISGDSQPLSKKMKLLEKYRTSDSALDVEVKMENEINMYLHLEVSETADENPLAFWKQQLHNFPYLSILAKNYLSISAASVPVEAMFSTTGLILNQKRSSMSPHRANILTVIHDNYSKFFPINREQAQKMSK